MGGVYAVVLTYNRQSLLRQCLLAIIGQTTACDGIIVFDNASTDGTAEMLQAEFPAVEIIQAQQNVGAAGGFNLSMQMAIAAGADRIWVMDDDVIAQPDALEHLQASLSLVEADGKYPPFMISTARDPAGELTNVPDIDRRRNSLHYQTRPAYLAYGLAPVTRSTFVSIPVPARTFTAHGYPLASMFIWGEDSEFTLRITKKQPGLMSGASKVTHVRAQAGQLDITTENDERRLRWHQYLVLQHHLFNAPSSLETVFLPPAGEHHWSRPAPGSARALAPSEDRRHRPFSGAGIPTSGRKVLKFPDLQLGLYLARPVIAATQRLNPRRARNPWLWRATGRDNGLEKWVGQYGLEQWILR
ncbi:glycosyltransferase [Devosia sp. A8/3-2]|nr:glycosyltransferase [Devosia sp. A8/3-2]